MMPDPIRFVPLIYMCKISKVMNGDEEPKNLRGKGNCSIAKHA